MVAKTIAETFDAKQVVAEVLAGDQQAFARLIEQYQKLVSHIVFRMISHQVDREELCQEIFIKVYRHLASFRFQSRLSTWIARIAYHACINFLKKKRIPLYDDLVRDAMDGAGVEEGRNLQNFADTVQGLPEQERIAVNKDLRHVLEREIAQLPLHFRALITLFHIEEMNLKEISEVMDMPEGTVKSYLFRARKLLKDRLTEQYQTEDLFV